MEILLISIWEFFKTAGLAVFSLGFFVMLGALAMFDGLKKMEQNGIDTDGVLYDDKDNPSTESGQALEDNSIQDKHALKEPPLFQSSQKM